MLVQAAARQLALGPGLAQGAGGHAHGLASALQRTAAGQPRRRPAAPAGAAAGRGRRGVVAASASLQQGSTATLPLDYYKMLRVSGVCSRDTLARALEKALMEPPSVGYSQQCLLARGSVLKRATETLLDAQGRRAYDDALREGNISEEVPDEFVPGVLALLVEAGEAGEMVVAAGEEWLACHRRDPRTRDVALSTALAHRDVAQRLAKKQGDAAAAAAMLEVAGELLRRHHAAPALQAEVAGDLAALQPALACQLVALPLERFQERERGVQVAISVLTDNSGAKRGMGKQEFLNRMADSLTASEQIAVYEAAGPRFAELPSELYDVALAYIADAVSEGGRPEQLERALGALSAAAAAVPPGATGHEGDSGLRQLAERRAIEERNRRAVARAACLLLLGETAAAADALGLGANGGEVHCERTLLAFIKANSPDRSDLLPGLCVLGQRWVADVALGSFRGSKGTPFSLDAWFEREAVRRYLARRSVGGAGSAAAPSPLLAAAGRASEALLAPFAAGLTGMLSLVGLLADEEQLQRLAEEEEAAAAEAERRAAAEAAIASAKAPAPPAPAPAARAAAAAEPPAAAELPAGRSPAEALQAAAAPDMAEVDMRAQRLAALQARQPKVLTDPAELRPRHTARPELTAAAVAAHAPPPPPVAMPPPVPEAAAGEDFDANVAFSMQPVEQLTPLEGEERMWDAEGQRNVRWGRLAATVALLAGGGFLLGRSGLLLRGAAAPAAPPPPAPAAAAAVQAKQAAAPAVVGLSRAEAAALIERWQEVKAAALGPRHDVKGLAGVLRGELLQQWRDRAQQIQAKGWHYLHTLEGSQINSVRVDAAAGTAAVSATFREAVEAHRGAAEPVQAFRSEYSVDYTLAREGGSWVLTGAVVRY